MNISIIICTYNPDLKVFERCLNAIARLKMDSIIVECILVDNNSITPISSHNVVQSFLRQCPWAKLVVEKKQGLSHARVCGFKNSRADFIIFFDDDNEPKEDYIINFLHAHKLNPHVGVWGPGSVTVEFTGEVEKWVAKYGKEKLQEIHIAEVMFSNDVFNFDYIPYGTGMVVRRRIVEQYVYNFENAKYTLSDRIGGSLNSSGDVQIVYEAAKLGYATGRSPQLKLKHLIPASRATFKYIKKLYAGTSLDNAALIAQSFPKKAQPPRNIFLEYVMFFYRATVSFCQEVIFKFNYKKWICRMAAMVAFKQGQFSYYNKNVPVIIKLSKRMLGI